MEPRRSNSTHPSSAVSSSGRGGINNNILNTVLVVMLVITSVIASVYLITRLVASTSNGGAVKSKQFQALFLTNGQVYFGHLSDVNDGYVKLTDIYYLQVQQQVQPGQSSSSSNPNVSLAKLGNELHGPEDVMYVAQSQVLFWENLKNSGKVVQAINTYQQQHPGTQ